MGASEILQILGKGEELTSKEISERSELSGNSISKAITRLLKDVSENMVFRILSPQEKENRYGHKVSCLVRVYKLDE